MISEFSALFALLRSLVNSDLVCDQRKQVPAEYRVSTLYMLDALHFKSLKYNTFYADDDNRSRSGTETEVESHCDI